MKLQHVINNVHLFDLCIYNYGTITILHSQFLWLAFADVFIVFKSSIIANCYRKLWLALLTCCKVLYCHLMLLCLFFFNMFYSDFSIVYYVNMFYSDFSVVYYVIFFPFLVFVFFIFVRIVLRAHHLKYQDSNFTTLLKNTLFKPYSVHCKPHSRY